MRADDIGVLPIHKRITLTFEIDVFMDRADALDRRDELIDHLKTAGCHLVLTDDGTRIVMSDLTSVGEKAECPYCRTTFYAPPLHDPLRKHLDYCPDRPSDVDDEDDEVPAW